MNVDIYVYERSVDSLCVWMYMNMSVCTYTSAYTIMDLYTEE